MDYRREISILRGNNTSRKGSVVDRLGQSSQITFSQPVRQISLMLISLALVAFGAYIAFPRVAPVFLANLWLNGAIALVFFIGVLACFFQVFQLIFIGQLDRRPCRRQPGP